MTIHVMYTVNKENVVLDNDDGYFTSSKFGRRVFMIMSCNKRHLCTTWQPGIPVFILWSHALCVLYKCC